MIPPKLRQAANGFGTTQSSSREKQRKQADSIRVLNCSIAKSRRQIRKTPIVTTLFNAQTADKKGALTPSQVLGQPQHFWQHYAAVPKKPTAGKPASSQNCQTPKGCDWNARGLPGQQCNINNLQISHTYTYCATHLATEALPSWPA